MNQQNLRSYGLSLILLALAVGSLGRTLHVADAIKMTLSAVSLLFSLVAIVMFVKATPANRRPITLGCSWVRPSWWSS